VALKLKVRWVKSASGHKQDQRATVRALGLRRLQHVVEHNDTPQIRGMLFKVRHLVEVTQA
jgi:large subunit ribosomal protein L30